MDMLGCFTFLIQKTGCELNLLAVHIYFEKSLANTVRKQFLSACIVGCLFHFEHALKLKLKELGINPTQIEVEMPAKELKFLIIIPKSKMRSKVSPCTKRVID